MFLSLLWRGLTEGCDLEESASLFVEFVVGRDCFLDVEASFCLHFKVLARGSAVFKGDALIGELFEKGLGQGGVAQARALN